MLTSTKRKGDLIISGFLFVLGLVWIYESQTMLPGDFSTPSPGFFPLLLGILLCGVSLAMGLYSFLFRKTERVKIGHPHIWLTSFILAFLGIFFESLGFVLSMSIFFFFLLKLLSRLNWIVCLLISILAASAAYGFFDRLLGIQLPSPKWF